MRCQLRQTIPIQTANTAGSSRSGGCRGSTGKKKNRGSRLLAPFCVHFASTVLNFRRLSPCTPRDQVTRSPTGQSSTMEEGEAPPTDAREGDGNKTHAGKRNGMA